MKDLKKGDLVRVSADHPRYGGQVGEFLRYAYVDLRAQGSNKVAVLRLKQTGMTDQWVGLHELERADVFDQIGHLSKET